MLESEQLAAKIALARFVLVFTGAGMSTGSGIPDFRGPNGLWKNWRPVYFQDFMTSVEARRRHWEFKSRGWEQFRDALPNEGHRALAALENKGFLQSLVTQNIDGLHQMAGNSPDLVTELHGTGRWIECTQCGKRFHPDPIFREFARTADPPSCECGGWLKPATISFGQAMPEAALARAFRDAAQTDLVISIGSTLEVQPAALVPLKAKNRGAFYAIINLGATAHDSVADLRVNADAASFLPEVVSRLTG